jgi:hypothetical protein
MFLLDEIRRVRDRAEIDRTAPVLQFRTCVHSTGESNGAAVVADGVEITLRHRTARTRAYRYAVTARAAHDGTLVISFRRVAPGGRTTVCCYREEIAPEESAADPRHEFESEVLTTRCRHCRLPAGHQVHAT